MVQSVKSPCGHVLVNEKGCFTCGPFPQKKPPAHSLQHGKWSVPGVPHKGWVCVDMFDRGHDNLELCEMCESADVRYVQVMAHERYDGTLEVGCICAGKMADDYKAAEAREKKIENRTKRRERWINRKAWRASTKGNATIKVEGYRVTVFRRGAQWAWSIALDKPEFSATNYSTPEAAALGAFDRFEEITGKWHKRGG